MKPSEAKDRGDFDLEGADAADDAKSPPDSALSDRPASSNRAGSGSGEKQKNTTLGDYKLLKKLGQGGMGTVYKAVKLSLDREVAIKVLSKELASKPAFVQRFDREAKVMAKLDHPNILRCFDAGEANGFHFLSMEFVEGGSVEDWLKKLGKFSVADSLHIVLASAAALQHAHEQSMIHRDIKPDNILLTKKGVVKVADLGLAKNTDDDLSLTRTGTGAGTPVYMAPEQARDAKHVDARVDIYALGCMLYMFLTGQPPFKGSTIVELIEAKEKGRFTPIRSLNTDVPERLDLICEKMVAKKPEHRYQTCAEVIADLENLGLAGDHLSFFGDARPSSASRATPVSKGPPVGTQQPPAAVAQTSGGKASPAMTAVADDVYFWSFEGPSGKAVTKKVTKAQLLTLLKSGTLDAQAQVSRTAKGGYRALGTYGEFQHIIKGFVTREKAERKTEKFHNIYEKLEAEEKIRQRWRFIENLKIKAGGAVALVLWLILIGILLVGAYYFLDWLFHYLAERVGGAGKA